MSALKYTRDDGPERKPFFASGPGIELYCGDMREVLGLFSPEADLILSDPPYPLTSGGAGSGMMRGVFSPEHYDNSGDLFDMVPWDEMAPLIYRAAADDADAIIMANDRQMFPAHAAFEAAGFGFHRVLPWDKITATPNRWFMPNCEYGLYFWKGHARKINDCGSKALIRCPQKDVSQNYVPEGAPERYAKGHPTEKPVGLLEAWIRNTTDEGGLVLDPFAGSGSAVIAAMRSGRRVVAIEKDPIWFETICNRVEAELARTQMTMEI